VARKQFERLVAERKAKLVRQREQSVKEGLVLRDQTCYLLIRRGGAKSNCPPSLPPT
jgi:hypothetical protein